MSACPAFICISWLHSYNWCRLQLPYDVTHQLVIWTPAQLPLLTSLHKICMPARAGCVITAEV
jgi:hypothetical protein